MPATKPTIKSLEKFFDRSLSGVIRGTVNLGGRAFKYRQWSGERCHGRRIALDTETELFEHPHIPRLALMSAYSGGNTAFLIHPEHVERFLLKHIDRVFICHNCAFDYWVVHKHLVDQDLSDLAKQWEQVVDSDRMADTMLLDQLLVLAKGSSYPRARNLSILADTYAGISEINKDDPYRVRYGEIIGGDWKDVGRGFWEYAVRDPVATWLAYDKMLVTARKIYQYHGVDKKVVRKFGLLSQKVQVKAAISLQSLTHRGLRLDLNRREATQEELRQKIACLVEQIENLPGGDTLFKKFKQTGKYQLTRNNVPQTNNKCLTEILVEIADRYDISIPLTPERREPTTSRKYWTQHSELSPFIATWVEFNGLAKLNQFFSSLKSERVHSRYTTIVRTGRTSCCSPNIQQIPRTGKFREMIIPSAGKLFFVIDYSALELRTLAAVCEDQFGESKLAEVLRNNRDPHEHTAAMIANVDVTDFAAMKKTDPEKYKSLRQRAKAVNFGVPGGLGPESLAEYAHINYGVDLTVEKAREWRERFLTEVYPEIGWYLESDVVEVLAENLGVAPRDVLLKFRSEQTILAAKRIVQGQTTQRNGEPYKANFVDQVWDSLISLNCNPELEDLLVSEDAGESLERELFFGSVLTSTGRVRGRATFTQKRNTPFQGMAADGAKLALWDLHKAGYHVVAFVHDEFVIELPEHADHTQEAATINHICCKTMEQVTGAVPVGCEYALCYRWSKEAEAVFSDEGRLLPWGDPPEGQHTLS